MRASGSVRVTTTSACFPMFARVRRAKPLTLVVVGGDPVRVVYAAGAVMVPADEPGDARLLAELLDWYGEAELAVGRLQARVYPLPAGSRRTCAQCGRRLRHMMCVQPARRLCLPCFKRAARRRRRHRHARLGAGATIEATPAAG